MSGEENLVSEDLRSTSAKFDSQEKLNYNSENTKKIKLPELDPDGLKHIENEAVLLAKDFCKLNKKLQESLYNISAASVCSLQVYEEAVNKNCQVIENILSDEKVFLIKAKELSRAMQPIYKLQEKINSIKTIVATLDSQI